MTISDVAAPAAPVSDVAAMKRASRIRHYAMTAPTFFAVEYAINPWMDTSTAVDTHVAMNQWEALRQTYKELGHTVELVEPVTGLPDSSTPELHGSYAHELKNIALGSDDGLYVSIASSCNRARLRIGGGAQELRIALAAKCDDAAHQCVDAGWVVDRIAYDIDEVGGEPNR